MDGVLGSHKNPRRIGRQKMRAHTVYLASGKTYSFYPRKMIKFIGLGEDRLKGYFSVAEAKIYLRVELENRIRFETLISDISARFVKLPSGEVDSEIDHALQQIRDFFKVDRCGMLGVREDKQFVWVTHASYAEGVEKVSKDINLAALFPWCYEKLIRGQHVMVSRMTELPPEAE